MKGDHSIMNKKSICAVLRSKDGSALMTVVVVFLFLMIMIATSAVMAQGNITRASKSNEYASAYYVAESGLNEYVEKLSDWLKTNTKSYKTNPGLLATEFLAANSADITNTIHVDYSTSVLNEIPRAEIQFVFIGTTETGATYELRSKGHLGDSSRQISRQFHFVETNNAAEGVGYNANAIYQIDLSDPSGSTLTPIRPSNWNTTLAGPIITNRPFDFDKGATLVGPIVTNNKITIGQGITSTNAVIITSNRIDFTTGNASNIGLIVLKPGGTLHLNGGWNTVGINRIMIPYGKSYEEVVTYANTNNNKAMWETLKTKVIYYNPVNFDPWDTSFYYTSGINPTALFGPSPESEASLPAASRKGYMYRDYFKSDFVLDNMQNTTIIKRYIPDVVLPAFPKLTDYPWFNETNAKMTIDSQISVDKDNNLTVVESYDGSLSRVLKLTKSVSLNSFTFNTGWSSQVTIDVGSKDIVLVTKKFNVTGSIKIKGSGSLTVYVLGDNGTVKNADLSLKFNGANSFQLANADGSLSTDIQKFKLYVAKSDNGSGKPLTLNLDLNQNVTFYGIIYSQNLNLISSIHFNGVFISIDGESLTNTASGNSSIDTPLIYMPKAVLDFQSKEVIGLIISKNVTFGGSTNFIFKQTFDYKLVNDILSPIVITVPGGGNSGTPGSGTGTSRSVKWFAQREVGDD